MAEKKVYVVTDLGPGDGGKGGVVHKVCSMKRAHTVLKVGGAQGNHGVRTSAGLSFAFWQWGCGTLEGVKTHITPNLVVSPEGLLNEADFLQYECGLHDAHQLMTIDRRALCAIGYHRVASRLREMSLKDNPRGTVGTGMGDAYRDRQRHPELAIYVSDLARSDLRDRIAEIRRVKLDDLASIIEGDWLPDDETEAEEEITRLRDERYIDFIDRRCKEAAARFRIVDPDFMEREILARDGVVVVESSHGVLTDHYHGFHPHTSAIRTLPCFTHAMLEEAGYDGQVVNLGVTRAYGIRHGAGPMPTCDPTIVERLLPGSHKDTNRWQGEVRVGPMDLVLLRYAIEVCGGPSAFDGLAITWFDQITGNGAWHVCDRYRNTQDRTFFSPAGGINVRRGSDEAQLSYQEALGRQLLGCTPEITDYELPTGVGRDKLFSFCADILQRELDVPVRMVSFGPTERDKICK